MRVISLFAGALIAIAGCNRHPAPAHDPALEIRAKVVFTQADHTTPRQALPIDAFGLWFPLIAGDLFGSANTDDFVKPEVAADYTASFDLNQSRAQIEQALKPGSIAEGRIPVQPAETRFARIASFTVKPQTQDRVGLTAWMDANESLGLILAYFDRPCSAVGSFVEEGREFRYKIIVPQAGFVWLRRIQLSEKVSETTVSPTPPSDLTLTVAPLT